MSLGSLMRMALPVFLPMALASCSLPEFSLPSLPMPSAISGEHAEAYDEPYRIHKGDVVTINVWRIEELSLKAKVTREGTVGYPLLGDILVEGKSAREVEEYVREELSKGYVENPVVTVTVQGTWRYFITGEIQQSGSYPLEEDINVYQAVIRAGGFTDFASRKVKIIRFERGERRVIKINLKRFLRPGDEIKEGRVMPGDLIVVKRSLL